MALLYLKPVARDLEVFDHAFAALQEQDRKRIIKPPRKNLAQFLVDSPLAGAELNLER